jgi:hypothetical protein
VEVFLLTCLIVIFDTPFLGTVAVVLDGSKPVEESLEYLTQATQKVKQLVKATKANISFVVLVNKVLSEFLLSIDWISAHLRRLISIVWH